MSLQADTVASIRADLMAQLTNGDSASIVGVGLPYKPKQITLMTSPSVCDSILAAYNGSLPADDSLHAKAGYVFRVGKTAYAIVPESWPHAIDYYLARNLLFVARVRR